MNKKLIHPKHRAYKVRAYIPEYIRVDKFGNELHFRNAKELRAFRMMDEMSKKGN